MNVSTPGNRLAAPAKAQGGPKPRSTTARSPRGDALALSRRDGSFEGSDETRRQRAVAALTGDPTLRQDFVLWDTLDLARRLEVADRLGSTLGSAYGFQPAVVQYDAELDGEDFDVSYFNPARNTVALGDAALASPESMVQAVVHEQMHAYQFKVVSDYRAGQPGKARQIDPVARQWAENFMDYRTANRNGAEETYARYANQAIEVHAREAADIVSGELFPGPLERLVAWLGRRLGIQDAGGAVSAVVPPSAPESNPAPSDSMPAVSAAPDTGKPALPAVIVRNQDPAPAPGSPPSPRGELRVGISVRTMNEAYVSKARDAVNADPEMRRYFRSWTTLTRQEKLEAGRRMMEIFSQLYSFTPLHLELEYRKPNLIERGAISDWKGVHYLGGYVLADPEELFGNLVIRIPEFPGLYLD